MSKRKQFKTYKKLTVSLFCLVCIGAGIATTSFSFSWFTNKNNVTRDINGYTAGAYFAGGKGEKDDPYIIKNPIHLYNLAWLYYIGYFKGKEPYFKISQDLDMNGWVLPPIGTSTNPFNGHLDGQEHTISNLTVSNSFEKLKARKPSSVTEDDWNGTTGKYGDTPNILGFFGYISKESDDKNVPTAENIRINKENVNSVSDKALVGVAAGYVNGSLNDIYIDNSNVNLADNTQALGTLNNETISSISEYTSVGYCTEAYQTKYNRYETTLYSPKVVGNCTYTLGKEDGGEGGWGGSIDMRMLNRRLTYTFGIGTFSQNNYGALISTGPKKIKSVLSSGYNWSPTSNFYWNDSNYDRNMYLMGGTCLPLSIDESAMGLTGTVTEEKKQFTLDGYTHVAYYNSKYLEISDENSTLENEIVSKANTGYFVGSGSILSDRLQPTKGAAIRAGYRQFKAGSYSGIPDSFITTTDGMVYDDYKDQFAMYTIKDDTTYRIIDDVNQNNYSISSSDKTYTDLGLIKYKGVRTNFDISMSGAKVFHGFHFQRYLPDSDSTTAANLTSYIYSGTANILNTEYSNYEFINGCLNFTVEKDGYITTIVGAGYAASNSGHSLFDLYQINRDENKKVTSITRISKVYVDANGNVAYNTQPSSDYSLKIDIKTLASTSNKLNKDAAYYFEIPVTAGDYLIGTASQSSENNAYLMYLDIGANGNDGATSETITRTKVFELLEQITQAFTYPTGVYIADFDNAVLDTKTLCITLGSTYSGKASISRTKENAELSVTVSSDNQTGVGYYDSDFTLTDTAGQALSDDAYLTTNKTISYEKRMTYYDYSSKNSTLTMFRFSQTSTDGGNTYSTITAESQYQATYETALSNWTKLETNQTVYDDDGKETEGIPTDIATSITQPDGIKDNNVFNLKLKDSCNTFVNTYLPKANLSTDFIVSISGYDFVMKNGDTSISSNDYSLIRDENYYLKINDDEYAAA